MHSRLGARFARPECSIRPPAPADSLWTPAPAPLRCDACWALGLLPCMVLARFFGSSVFFLPSLVVPRISLFIHPFCRWGVLGQYDPRKDDLYYVSLPFLGRHRNSFRFCYSFLCIFLYISMLPQWGVYRIRDFPRNGLYWTGRLPQLPQPPAFAAPPRPWPG